MIEIRHENMATSNETKSAYNKIFLENGIVRKKSYSLWLLSLIKLKSGDLLVDASCGQGQLVDLAQKRGAKAIGFDLSFEGVRKGVTRNPASGWFVADGEKCCLPNHVADFVMSIGSLEHYQDIEKGISEIARIVKNDGIVCILLPNSFSLFGNIRYVIGNGDVFDDGQPLQRYNTYRGWKSLLERNGLVVLKTIKFETTPLKTLEDLMWFLIHPLKLLRLIVSVFLPINLSNDFVYLCRPRNIL